MVQPTPHLLLRPAVSLVANLSLLAQSKVPLTPSESRKLLKLLTTSFRHQLDKEHGASSSNHVHNGSHSAIPASTSGSSKASEKLPSRPNTTPADRHLHDILSNPLFSFQAPPRRIGPKDPMDVFDRACASGFMTVSRARNCLYAKRDILQTPPEEAHMRMRSSGSGSKVFKWLLSTGAENDSSWLHHANPKTGKITRDIIIEFLILEGKQEVLWDLFEHYVAHKLHNAGMLLYQLSSILTHHISIEAGYESVVRASEILNRLEVPSKIHATTLHKALSCMVDSTKFTTLGHAQPSPKAFDRFLGVVQAAAAVPPGNPKYALYAPRLHLCHPTKPDAGPALRYLKNLDEAPPEMRARATPALSQSVVWLALDCATYLLQHEQHDDAMWVMNFIQKTYPEQIGLVRKQTEADATSLEMLNNLELGLAGV